jgi:SPP1 gp7 family putative phage head morphogenesis protein
MAYTLRRDKLRNSKVLRPVRPNTGSEALYRKRLLEEVEAMGHSVAYWLEQVYRQYPPAMAMDAVPANELRDAMAKVSRMWTYRFDRLTEWLAGHFARDVSERSDHAFTSALRNAGFTVRFTMTPAMRDILNATIHENVNLIHSIPRQYLSQVEGMVMRSVQTGRDLSQLSGDLQSRLGVTKKRAALIARDQNNKATSAFTRARQTELGITEAVWQHSGGGKTQRASHVRMSGKTYDVKRGMWDPTEGRNVFPGELINCRCTSRSVIAGFA